MRWRRRRFKRMRKRARTPKVAQQILATSPCETATETLAESNQVEVSV